MKASKLRELLVELLDAQESETDAVTRLLRLAVALNEWNYPCVLRIECGYAVQDANYVGDIELLLGDARGAWGVTVRASRFGNLITLIDPNKSIDAKRERALKEIFRHFGYEFVPHWILTEPCGPAETTTWFDRYFS